MMATLKKQNQGEKAVPMLQASKKCYRRRRMLGRCKSMGWLNDCGEMDQAIGALKKANNPNWDAKLNRLLQEIAWEAVTRHPLSGVKAEAKTAMK